MADVLVFQKDSRGNISTLAQLEQKFGFQPDGTNYYIGINKITVASFRDTARGLMPKHRAFFDEVLDSLKRSGREHKTIVLGLEPPSKLELMSDEPNLDSPYEYVERHLDLVTAMARELAEYQHRAAKSNKELRIYVRYASEMNDRQAANLYAGSPTEYVKSYRKVRTIFDRLAPEVLFSFSPAIRADLMDRRPSISEYWPGADFVDVVAGTWYSGTTAQMKKARAHLDFYLLAFDKYGKPFAIDELGGREVDPPGVPHIDRTLLTMVAHLAQHTAASGFAYITAFCESKWGADHPSAPEPGHEPRLTEFAARVAELPRADTGSRQANRAHSPVFNLGLIAGEPVSVKVIPAESWGAIPKGPFERTIPQFIVIHHTASPNPPDHRSQGGVSGCKQFAREIQRSHLDRGFSDSGHNFLNTVDGTILEGRHGSLRAVEAGFCVQSAHAAQDPGLLAGGNKSPGIENEGNFMHHDMQEAQWNSLVELCAYLCRSCNLSPTAIRGHREFSITDCPGDRLFAELPRLRSEVAARLGVTLSEPEAPNFTPSVLKLGSRGESVRQLQDRLRQLGFAPGASDGIFGENTRAAVMAFQRSVNIESDGIVGSETRQHLNRTELVNH